MGKDDHENPSIIACLPSVVFLAPAVTLVAYSLDGLAYFAWYTGEYSDEHLILYDNGVYPSFGASRCC